MKYKALLLKFTTLLLFSYSAKSQEQLTTELNKVTLPFSLTNAQKDLVYLDTLLINNTILGLGEETHATADFFLTKNEIIQYCVTNLHYKTIGIEADVNGTKYVNTYITKGEGTVKNALYEMGTAAWMTEEVRSLVEWLRLYNQNKLTEQQITFWGFDMQFANITIRELKGKYLTEQLLSTAPYTELDSLPKWKMTDKLNKEKWKTLESALLQYKTNIEPKEKQSYTDLIIKLQQYISYKSAKTFFEGFMIRDRCMAENVIQKQQRSNEKMILWAHNEHLSKGETFTKWVTMGNRLHQQYQNQYYTVGLFTGDINLKYYNRNLKRTDSLTTPLHTQKNSLNTILSKCDKPSFYIDINSAAKSNKVILNFVSKNYLTRAQEPDPTQHNGYGFREYHRKSVPLNQKYNALIFIKYTQGANPMK